MGLGPSHTNIDKMQLIWWDWVCLLAILLKYNQYYGAYMQKAGDTWDIYLRKFFWIFRKILGWERKINTAPKPSPEVAPSKMEVAPS